MAKYAMVFDLNKCTGCRACVMACKAEWGLQSDRSRCWVKPVGPENTPHGLASTFYVGLCNHCDEPSCVKECPTTATYKTENGMVLVNKELCIGCGNCIVACPYGARYVSSIDKKVEKCTFCESRIAIGKQPACVQTCPTNARIFGDLEDRKSEVYKKVYIDEAVPIATEKTNLHPNAYYIGKVRDIHLLANTHTPKKVEVSAPNQLWRIISPLMVAGFGATIFGVTIAFINQLIKGEKED
ncbi:MAG: 4Fe-4S dicluster domain-containing protein [Nitrospirae bacterium]|nr:4Fe-4S dicluster domain-containing protein [Nitrospirota bacterium]